MESNIQAYLNCAKYLPGFIDHPVAFFDLKGALIVCTHPARSSFAQLVAEQCLKSADPRRTAGVYSALFELLTSSGGQPLCRVLLLDASGREDLIPPIRTLLRTILEEQSMHSRLSFESNDRLSFLRKVLYSDAENEAELHELALQHQMPYEAPRAVILFDLCSDSDSVSLDTKKEIFSKVIPLASGYSFEDLYDFLNPHQVAMLKMLPDTSAAENAALLEEFVHSVLTVMKSSYQFCLRASIGSIYPVLSGLSRSYSEASFLHDYFDFFDTEGRNILFVTGCISDYLFSFLPDSWYREKFAPLLPALQGRSGLPETVEVLSKHSMNLKKAAAELGLHRNTLLQRYQKLVTQADFDPVSDRRDRISARQFALYRNRKTIIRAGVAIRGNDNIPTILFNKLAEFLDTNSGGNMRLELFTVGLSGNNLLTLELIREGRLNIGFGDVGMLYPLLGKRLSVLNTPFLFESPRQALQVMNGAVGRELLRPMEDHGLLLLAWLSMGWRYFSSDAGAPIRCPEDLRGKTIRIMRNKPLLEAFLQYLGTEPRYISYDKLPAAVFDSLVDVQENPYQNFYDMRLYRKHKNLLELNMNLDSSILLSSMHFFERLTENDREIFMKSVRETVSWFSSGFYNVTAAAKQRIQEEGTVIHAPSQEEERLWQSTVSDFLDSSPYAESCSLFFEKILRFREEKP